MVSPNDLLRCGYALGVRLHEADGGVDANISPSARMGSDGYDLFGFEDFHLTRQSLRLHDLSDGHFCCRLGTTGFCKWRFSRCYTEIESLAAGQRAALANESCANMRHSAIM